eukprot:TRINITY_DN67194_c0_g1_i1.p1 TRINITY_DN67194_c0_g1~~TRINITY_DN67194_c0_g1_i1.p1  ORF type:complete len:464 (-),score=115.86 TRINITY_DN67194_c0_g1_i1:24-1379(-)
MVLPSLEALILAAGLEFRSRLLRRLPTVKHSLPVSLLMQLLAAAPRRGEGSGPCLHGLQRWRPSEASAAQLMRLATSRDPLPGLAHSGELLQLLAEAYFEGRLAPLKFSRADEEVLLALGGRCFSAELAGKELDLSANLVALGAKRIASEATRRLGLGLNKEVLLCALHPSSDQVLAAWLPALSSLGPHEEAIMALKSRGDEGTSSTACLHVAVDWQYPTEAEGGQLMCRTRLSKEPVQHDLESWRLEAKCYHRQQSQEWHLESRGAATGQEGTGYAAPQGGLCTCSSLEFVGADIVKVSINLVGRQPDPKDAEIVLFLWEPVVSGYAYGRHWAKVWLPPLEKLDGGWLKVPFETGRGSSDIEAELELSAAWRYPLLQGDSKVAQRGRGLLEIQGMRLMHDPLRPPPAELRAELQVLHFLEAARAEVGADASDSLCRLRLRLKQNRPSLQK